MGNKNLWIRIAIKCGRVIFTLLMLGGVYTETGIWTSLSLFLIIAYIENKLWVDRVL